MAVQFSERQTNDTLRYLQGLFDIQKFKDENSKDGDKAIINSHPHQEAFDNIKKVVDEVMNHSKYNKVDLNQLFAFMDK